MPKIIIKKDIVGERAKYLKKLCPMNVFKI